MMLKNMFKRQILRIAFYTIYRLSPTYALVVGDGKGRHTAARGDVRQLACFACEIVIEAAKKSTGFAEKQVLRAVIRTFLNRLDEIAATKKAPEAAATDEGADE